ncbi:hypothetical protein VTH06DRAFT_5429 [Thermothelomyces fergusii]
MGAPPISSRESHRRRPVGGVMKQGRLPV